jgi:hypothetical protein
LGKVTLFVEPFRKAKIAHHRFAARVQENISRLEIAVKKPLSMRIFDGPSDFCEQLDTFARFAAKRRPDGAQASARRQFHAEKGKTIFGFTDLVNRKNVRMIETGRCFGLASEARECLV